MTALANPSTGWYWVQVGGTPKQVWIDTVFQLIQICQIGVKVDS